VEPKRIALAQATAEKQEVEAKLAILQSGLKELMDRLAKLDAGKNLNLISRTNANFCFHGLLCPLSACLLLLVGLRSENVFTLSADCTSSIEKKNALAAKAEECTIKMDRADRLIGGLGDENIHTYVYISMYTYVYIHR